jgi:hypothetical protein
MAESFCIIYEVYFSGCYFNNDGVAGFDTIKSFMSGYDPTGDICILTFR